MAILCLVAGASAAPAEPFSVEQVMRAPFASDLATAPGGAVVAWIVNDCGVRNVWVAEAPGWGGRRLTAYEKEDGQELGELEFAPEGRRLVYVRGGSPNRRDEAPNPTSDPRGTEQAVAVLEQAREALLVDAHPA